MRETFRAATAEETHDCGRALSHRLIREDVVLFTGELGAGKTTMIRGILSELGYERPVRSPTFNLIQVYSASVPVMHADLYRLKSAAGIGLEEYLDDHLCLIEWPDRLGDLVSFEECWRVEISFTVDSFSGDGRLIQVTPPLKAGNDNRYSVLLGG